MDQPTPPLEPMPAPVEPQARAPVGDRASSGAGSSLRRIVVTAGLAGALLLVGGVAAVSAASPDPSSAPSTTAPSGQPGGTGHSSANCPHMGGSTQGPSGGSNGTNPSDGTSGASAAPTPAT